MSSLLFQWQTKLQVACLERDQKVRELFHVIVSIISDLTIAIAIMRL